MMYRSPPFVGSWGQNNMVGYGKTKKKKKNDKKREKDCF